MTIENFQMKVFPKTIEHLGIKMYATFPIALAELIANAYDAEATRVDIEISTEEPRKIVVRDNGKGMSPEEVNDKFLLIGRNRRETDGNRQNAMGRTIMGRKGLGKLALFGLGNVVEIRTSQKGNPKGVSLVMNWTDIRNAEDYTMPAVYFDKEEKEHGTTVILTSLKKKISFTIKELAADLSRMFRGLDKNFKVYISLNSSDPMEVTSDLCFEGLEHEFEWKIPGELTQEIHTDYPNKDKVTGFLFTTPKPNNCRGITLYANGRLVQAPSFFNMKTSSYIYAYLTGVLNADFIDEDPNEETITTNRQAIDWSAPAAEGLEEYLQLLIKTVENKWRAERPSRRNQKLREYEEKLKQDAKNFQETMSKNIAASISEKIKKKEVPDAKQLKEEIKKEITNQNPFLGLKKEIHILKKKILISHYGEDKIIADLLYELLLFNGIPAEDILYTNSLNPDSRIPVGSSILDYLREFFVDSYSNEKICVLYVTSDKTQESWNVMLEIGAGWIARSAHHVFTISGFKPQEPLDRRTEWCQCFLDRTTQKISISDRDKSQLIEKIKFICNSLDITHKDDQQIDRKIKQFLQKHGSNIGTAQP